MKAERMRWKAALTCGVLTLALLGGAVNVAQAQDHRAYRGERGHFDEHGRFQGHQFFDNRFGHGRYYPPRGMFVDHLPYGYRSFYWRGRPYFFFGGVWYVAGPGGYIVAAPPFGLVVPFLPSFYTTVWFGGVPYYYADDTYYQWDPGANAYEVVPPPGGNPQTTPPPGVAPPPGEAPPPPPGAAPAGPGPEQQDQLYVYPKNGQSQAQQNQDRYECHTWATGQTGFDPTQPGGGVPPDQNGPKRAQYRRAMTACLNARGYSVN